MTPETSKAIYTQVMAMDADDLNTVIHMVKLRREQLNNKAKYQFRVGDRVEFDAKARGIQMGVIESIGPKNIKVRCSGVRWTVTPALLKKVEGESVAKSWYV